MPLPGFLHADNPNYYRLQRDGATEEAFSQRLADHLESLILDEGPETVAAFFAEPVQGGGAITPPRGYFAAIQAVLRRYHVLFIADEVICGFGRTGNYWGSQTYDLQPDMVSCAKQLSASYQPISALMVGGKIHAAMIEASRRDGSFGQGYTYGGHPVACAVALEALKINEERDIVRRVSPAFLDGLAGFADHPMVGDVRGVGLIAGVELVADKATREAFVPTLGVGMRVQKACERAGLIVRAIGDPMAFTPPLIIDEAEIGELCRRFGEGLDAAWAELQPMRHAAE